MSQTVCVIVNPEDVARLEAIVTDRNRALKHAQRAKIVLASSQRVTAQEVARRTGGNRPAIWRWQARFAEQGVEAFNDRMAGKTDVNGKSPQTEQERRVAEAREKIRASRDKERQEREQGKNRGRGR